jgi:hypothetical protein
MHRSFVLALAACGAVAGCSSESSTTGNAQVVDGAVAKLKLHQSP